MATVSLLKHRLTVADHRLLNDIRIFLFDCDGVIWKGKEPIPGAVDTLNMLKKMGKKVFYLVGIAERM